MPRKSYNEVIEGKYFHDFELKKPFTYTYNSYGHAQLYNEYDVCRNCFHSRGYVNSFGMSACPGPNPPRVEIPEPAPNYVTEEKFELLLDLLARQADIDVRESEYLVELENKIARLEARVLLVESQALYAEVRDSVNRHLAESFMKDAQDNQNSTSYGFLSTAEHMDEAFPTDHLPEGSH